MWAALKKVLRTKRPSKRAQREYAAVRNASNGVGHRFEIHTTVPSKWLLIDLETGQAYKPRLHDEGGLHWEKIHPPRRKS